MICLCVKGGNVLSTQDKIQRIVVFQEKDMGILRMFVCLPYVSLPKIQDMHICVCDICVFRQCISVI